MDVAYFEGAALVPEGLESERGVEIPGCRLCAVHSKDDLLEAGLSPREIQQPPE